MADTGDTITDLQAHEATFHAFTGMMKWGTVAVAIVVAGVVFLLAS
jgi:hypothetical protein